MAERIFPGSKHVLQVRNTAQSIVGNWRVQDIDRITFNDVAGENLGGAAADLFNNRFVILLQADADTRSRVINLLGRYAGWPVINLGNPTVGFLRTVSDGGTNAQGVGLIYYTLTAQPSTQPGDTGPVLTLRQAGGGPTYFLTSPGRTDSDGTTQLNTPDVQALARTATRSSVTLPLREATNVYGTLHVEFRDVTASITDNTGNVVLEAQDVIEGSFHAPEAVDVIVGTLAVVDERQYTIDRTRTVSPIITDVRLSRNVT